MRVVEIGFRQAHRKEGRECGSRTCVHERAGFCKAFAGMGSVVWIFHSGDAVGHTGKARCGGGLLMAKDEAGHLDQRR